MQTGLLLEGALNLLLIAGIVLFSSACGALLVVVVDVVRNELAKVDAAETISESQREPGK